MDQGHRHWLVGLVSPDHCSNQPSGVRSPGQPDRLSVILGNGDQNLMCKGTPETRQIDYLESLLNNVFIVADVHIVITPGHEYQYNIDVL